MRTLSRPACFIHPGQIVDPGHRPDGRGEPKQRDGQRHDVLKRGAIDPLGQRATNVRVHGSLRTEADRKRKFHQAPFPRYQWSRLGATFAKFGIGLP